MIRHLSRLLSTRVSRIARRRTAPGQGGRRATGSAFETPTGIPGRRGTGRRSVLLSLVLTFGAVSVLYAHLALRASSPSGDERLLAVPSSVDLSFTEPVELGLSSVILTGPDGQPVELGALTTNETRDLLSASIAGDLRAGVYTVEWQAVGRDGHPVRGTFGFVIEEGASGIRIETPEVATPIAPPDDGVGEPATELPTFETQSPLYAAVRWLAYLGILGAIGSVGFAFLLTSSRVRSQTPPGQFEEIAGRGAAGLGIFAALALGASLPLRLQAQSHALFGAGVTAERFSLLLGSAWGSAWLVQMAGAVVLLLGLLTARRGLRWGWYLATLGAVASAVTLGFSGHAAAVEGLRGLAIAADAVHVIGVGVWLGTLVVLLVVGVPVSRRVDLQRSGDLIGRLVRAFSPLALAAGGLVVATGVLASLLHLTALADLWQTPYGRLLALKLLLVLAVMAAGALNWRVVGPSTAAAGGERRLLRTAGAELAIATLVVAITAVLVAVPAPAHSDTAITAAPTAQVAESASSAALDPTPEP